MKFVDSFKKHAEKNRRTLFVGAVTFSACMLFPSLTMGLAAAIVIGTGLAAANYLEKNKEKSPFQELPPHYRMTAHFLATAALPTILLGALNKIEPAALEVGVSALAVLGAKKLYQSLNTPKPQLK